MTANCGDCHAQDGRDLAYFAYSNRAIVEKARQVGLSTEQGEAIASYVRSLAVPPLGRPWNPPFQPGPGLDARPAREWAAGAGVDAVLADDRVILAHLFPDGIAKEAIAASRRANAREIPIGIQLPDWNEWLPRVHPKDAWPDAFAARKVQERYEVLRERAAAGGESYARGAMTGDLQAFADAANGAAATPSGAEIMTREQVEARYGQLKWQAVKVWEILHELGLEETGGRIYAPAGEPRSWIGTYNFAFRATPYSAHVPWTEALAVGGSKLAHTYLDNAWQHLGLVLNPSNGPRQGFEPIDWAAFYDLGEALEKQSGRWELGRTLLRLVRGLQEADNGTGPGDPHRGFSLRLADLSHLLDPELAPMWGVVSAEERRQIVQAVVGAWWDAVRRWPVEAWRRGDGHHDASPADYEPRGDRWGGRDAAKIFSAVPRMYELGVDRALVGQILDWGKAMWPKGKWDALRP
jgi:hypothetical protein